MPYLQLENYDDLAIWFDDLTAACQTMIAKTGAHGQTPESLMQVMLKFINTGNLFLMISEEEGKFKGFIMGLLIVDEIRWVEVLALWAPGASTGKYQDAWDYFLGWARVNGAKRVQTTITRNPNTFYDFFYKPLGFRKIGYVLEADI